MESTIQSFKFNQQLKKNKNIPKERIYQQLLAEVDKAIKSLANGKMQFVNQISVLNKLSVDDAKEVVDRIHEINGDLSNYIRVVYETEAFVDSTLRDTGRTDLTHHNGRRLKRLTITIDIK